MTSRDFCYWLQGYFELKDTIDHRPGATPETMEIIKKHLALVFFHEIDPSYSTDKKKQEEMNNIHGSGFNSVFKPGIPGRDENGNMMRC